MSATLVHRNPSLMNSLIQDSRGVSVITPVMAVSVCRPPIVEGVPSRSGSAVHFHSRHSSARSLPSRHHIRILNHGGSIPMTTAISLSSSMPMQPHPPVTERISGDDKEGVSLPRICSPVQLCSGSNSQINLVAAVQATTTTADAGHKNEQQTLPGPEKSSTFPNFRALQGLAASAKLRLNNLKSKEAKAVTSALDQEREALDARADNQLRDSIVLQRLSNENAFEKDADCSLSSQDEGTTLSSFTVHKSSAAGNSKSRSKKFHRSRSRKRGAKSAFRKKGKSSASPGAKGGNLLGNYTLASMMPLSSRLENTKKVETFSVKYSNNKSTPRRSKTKATPLHGHQESAGKVTSPRTSLTTVALDRRAPATSPRTVPSHSNSNGMPTPRIVLEQAATVYESGTRVSVRLGRSRDPSTEQGSVKKVFLSEKQSSALKECGKLVPCAPPASPTPEQLLRYEYVPSLTDLRSQRALKDKLTTIDGEEKKRRQKLREDRAKHEKQMARSNICAQRQRQRQEIYALNKKMHDLEQSQFLKFCEAQKNQKK